MLGCQIKGGQMKAFLGKQSIKDKYIKRVHDHFLADDLIKGTYWENGKGCAVGCTIHSSDHNKYEKLLGIPEWLARLEDCIFEELPNSLAKEWPERFLSSINVGSDLEKIKTSFTIFILESCLDSMNKCKFNKKNNPDVSKALETSKDAILQMIKCHKERLDTSAAESAASAARSAAWSAESAERSAAWIAERSAAHEKYADKLIELIKDCK
jgi:hypothetical protein